MKKLLFATLAFTALIFASCVEETDPLASDELLTIPTVTLDASAEVVLESSYEDIDLITDEGIEQIFMQAGGPGGPGGRGIAGPRTECAEVAHDTINHTITIDFGEGCEGPGGMMRSGIIVITYEGRPRLPGSFRKVTFNKFFLDSIQVEGVRTLTNVTDSADIRMKQVMESTLAGGKLTFPDGSTITREASHIRTVARGERMGEGYTALTGSASGALKDGTTYTSEILEEIVYTRGCMVRAPVSGIKQFVAGDLTRVLDFGDGECDYLVEVTTNGVTETIELRGRRDMQGGPRDKEDQNGG